MKRLLFLVTVLLTTATNIYSQSDSTYTLVVYNVENLFDADGQAQFDDYKPEVYTPRHVLTKVSNMVDLMLQYNDGRGPDILVLSEVESDQTQSESGNESTVNDYLQKYSGTTLRLMLTDEFNDEIADLSSELLILKGFYDAGITDYDVQVAYAPFEEGRPTHTQKNVIISRIPIKKDYTKSHPLLDARPILEVWFDVNGHDLAVFANHWKSRASDAEIEQTRVQNAAVLRHRLDQIMSENPTVDFVLGGDFNSDYNQSNRYSYMDVTGVNDILKSVGDESMVAYGSTNAVYNLWYEHPIDRRGSDVFRGYWGTLMQIMISPGMYDDSGVTYVDNSFEVLRVPGVNVYETSGAPIRWSAVEDGYGLSDHLPISMSFKVDGSNSVGSKIQLQNPSYNDDSQWKPIEVKSDIPREGQYFISTEVQESIRTMNYFDKMFLVEGEVSSRGKVMINNEIYDLYSPVFDVREKFSVVGSEVGFFGRLGLFRGNWQFVIDAEEYLLD
jgi:endonuclease/exonuclease/phosphatase family metal-dependent hydrolase